MSKHTGGEGLLSWSPGRYTNSAKRGTQTPALLPDTSQPPRPPAPALLANSSLDRSRRPRTAPWSLGVRIQSTVLARNSDHLSKTFRDHVSRGFPRDPDSIDFSLVQFEMQTPSTSRWCNSRCRSGSFCAVMTLSSCNGPPVSG